MTTRRYVPKQELIDRIQGAASRRESAIFTILTDSNRSVLLRFSEGRMVRSYARTKEIADVVQALNECGLVAFSAVQVSPEERQEIIAVDDFLRLISPGVEPGSGFYDSPASGSSEVNLGVVENDLADDLLPVVAEAIEEAGRNEDASRPVHDMKLRRLLTRFALEYIGPVATLIVEEAMTSAKTAVERIEYVASCIPDAERADAFRKDVRARMETL